MTQPSTYALGDVLETTNCKTGKVYKIGPSCIYNEWIYYMKLCDKTGIIASRESQIKRKLDLAN